MKILVVATKSPWPPIDGGRLVLLNTIDALTDLGHEVTVVTPVDAGYLDLDLVAKELGRRCQVHLIPSRSTGALRSIAEATVRRRPLTIVRHSLTAVHRQVEALVQEHRYDVVHAEQLQAVAQTSPATRQGVPVVLRAQNVESKLWTFAGRYRSPFLRPLFRREARRLAAWEAENVRKASLTIALTGDDARHLRLMAGPGAEVEAVRAPFPVKLPPCEAPLGGEPSVVILASRRWIPNRDAVWGFARDCWPMVLQAVPAATLHVFGIAPDSGQTPNVVWHEPPGDSQMAFPRGAIVAIPARHPTGVPMKGLEAWARGLPIVASPEAAVALEASHRRELMVASAPEDFADAIAEVGRDERLARRLVGGGRQVLEERHNPKEIASRLVEIYRRAAKR